jgi:hypothetical protein
MTAGTENSLKIRKRNFYKKALCVSEKLDVEVAAGMLAKLVKINYTISGDHGKGLADAMDNIIQDLALPLGIATLNKKP